MSSVGLKTSIKLLRISISFSSSDLCSSHDFSAFSYLSLSSSFCFLTLIIDWNELFNYLYIWSSYLNFYYMSMVLKQLIMKFLTFIINISFIIKFLFSLKVTLKKIFIFYLFNKIKDIL